MKQEKSKVTSGYHKLDEWVTIWRETLPKYFGYPFNEVSPLRDFYEWYYAAGINLMNLNNAGDPFTDTPWEVRRRCSNARSLSSSHPSTTSTTTTDGLVGGTGDWGIIPMRLSH